VRFLSTLGMIGPHMRFIFRINYEDTRLLCDVDGLHQKRVIHNAICGILQTSNMH
jgi:hypothetical protein